MLESSESLLPTLPSERHLQVITAGYDSDSLDELDRLLHTLGVVPVARLLMAVKKISPATYIGKGKIDELKKIAEEKGADAIVINVELSPNQLRNAEKELGKPTLDRPGVIIEIF